MGEEGRDPGTHCSCMPIVHLVTDINLFNLVCAERSYYRDNLFFHRGGSEVRLTAIALKLSVYIIMFEAISELQRKRLGYLCVTVNENTQH